MLFALVVGRLSAGTSELLLFSQQLDHFTPGQNQTFEQRFVIDNRFTEFPLERIVLEIQDLRMINISSPFSYSVLEIGKAARATLLTLELRCFYHKALVNRVCTVRQIIADHASFLDWLSRNVTSRVIAVGGGYGGTFAAWLRMKYPRAVGLSWASSSPLLAAASVDFAQHFTNKLGDSCFSNFVNKTSHIVAALTGGDRNTLVAFRFDPASQTAKRPDVMSYLIFTSLALMEFRNDETNLLERLCQDPENLSVFYREAFDHLDLNVTDLSPVEDVRRSEDAAYHRAIWDLHCWELGGFPLIPDHNLDFYRGLCGGALGDFDNVTNAEFFGTGDSTQFSSSADDLAASLMAATPCRWRDVVVRRRSPDPGAQLSAPYADLRQPKKGESQNLTSDRQVSIQAAVDWLLDTCARNCSNGDCVGQTCICKAGYNGALCNSVEVTVGKYKWVTSCVTIGPTLVVLLGALVAWKTILRESDDYRPLTVQKV
jgi:hypothetical protein